jgi:hypothetical protein
MNRLSSLLLTGVLAASLGGACATTTTTTSPESRLACLAPAVRNPPAHLARDTSAFTGGAPTVRNPPPAVVRGLSADAGQGARVANPSDPNAGRGNRRTDCSLRLAHGRGEALLP